MMCIMAGGAKNLHVQI